MTVTLQATVTCPSCDHRFPATMPEDACVQRLPCPSCGKVMERQGDDCCVFCSHADHDCPSEQETVA